MATFTLMIILEGATFNDSEASALSSFDGGNFELGGTLNLHEDACDGDIQCPIVAGINTTYSSTLYVGENVPVCLFALYLQNQFCSYISFPEVYKYYHLCKHK